MSIFRTQPLAANMPVILGLLGVWYGNFFDAPATAVLPYDQYLHRFGRLSAAGPIWSRTARARRAMEKPSPGRPDPFCSVNREPTVSTHFINCCTRGTRLIPADFIAAADSQNPIGNHHTILLSNVLAQTRALMMGKTEADVRASLSKSGMAAAAIDALAPHRAFGGNRPTNTILYKRLTPRTLGRLIALYEHKIFVQGILWNINSFDQWGVELGKQLAQEILPVLSGSAPAGQFDASTNGLVTWLQAHK